MRILYLTRKFPPSIGGMQTQSREFYAEISRNNDVVLISWGYSQLFLPFFLAYAFIRAALALLLQQIEVIQLGDLVLSPLGLLLKYLFQRPVLTVSHGRDCVYSDPVYDLLILGSAKRLDKIICVSSNNKQRLSARGIPETKMVVIPNGIGRDGAFKQTREKKPYYDLLEAKVGLQLKDRKVILAACRLVPKKGIKEFIEKVFIKIAKANADAILLIAGEGPEKNSIFRAISSLNLQSKIRLIGNIKHSSPLYEALFAISQVFVMPNIRVNNDAEGFGIVVLEAGINGVPVVAYDVDGIGEALHDGNNGILIEAGDSEAFSSAVISLLEDGELRAGLTAKAKDYVINNFNWNRITGEYRNEYLKLIKQS